MNRLFYISLFAICIALFSCHGRQQKSSGSEQDSIPQYCDRDTAIIEQLVTSYLEHLKNKEFDKALFLLYDIHDGKVFNLTDQERSDIKQSWALFPVLDYKVDSVSLRSDICRAYYTIFFAPKVEGDPRPNYIKMTFSPAWIDGEWYLGIDNHADPIDF